MIAVLSGGTGSAKFVRGLASVVGEEELSAIVNVGDNIQLMGLCICPDIDTITYTLASLSDPERGWGIRGDTFHALQALSRFGFPEWFRVGDRDLATHVFRSHLLQEGETLTEATKRIASVLGVKAQILPATNEKLETIIVTDSASMHFQEYWVRHKAAPRIKVVEYRGSERAEPTREVLTALKESTAIILSPANPITSIGPILAIRGLKEALQKAKARKIAVSPIVGRGPVSGPAGKLMADLGVEVSALGVATLYRGLVDTLMIDKRDAYLKPRIESLGMACAVGCILMKNFEEEKRLAEAALSLAEQGPQKG